MASSRLVWHSNPLTERDLCIPHGENTNPTGSMGFNKGAMCDIDQRHYFRDEVFGFINWSNDQSPSKSHIQRASANFEIKIDGESYGFYMLSLSHNTLTNTTTYNQNNSMTNIHWGAAQYIIGQSSLLNKTMKIFDNTNGVFTIFIYG